MALAGLVSLGAGCPLRQSDREPEAWTEEVRLRVGESAEADEGRLVITLLSVVPGNRLGTVGIRLASPDGRSAEEEVQVVRNTLLSSAARLGPYAVRVMGYPGVDSARFQVAREYPADPAAAAEDAAVDEAQPQP